mgnify:CR=1 FL=1
MGGSLKKLTEKLNRPLTINLERLGAIGLLFGIFLLGFMILVYPFINLTNGYRDTLEKERFKLQKLEHVAALKEPLKQRLENIKSLSGKNEAFLPTTTAALASADLQTRIKETVAEAGGELASTQVIPEKAEDNITRVGVKVRLNGSTSVLRNILHSFESGKKALFIDNLNIRPIRMPMNPQGKNQGVDDKLSVDFDVIGYMQTP